MCGYPNTCVQKPISKRMRYLNKCSFDCSDELCKAEVQGEAMQVLEPFFQAFARFPAGVECMILFTWSLPISENINSPLLFVLYFWTSKVRAKKLLFGFFWWSKPARLVPAQLLPLFKIVTEEGNAKCDCLSLKSCTSENHRNIFHHTDQQICFQQCKETKERKN